MEIFDKMKTVSPSLFKISSSPKPQLTITKMMEFLKIIKI